MILWCGGNRGVLFIRRLLGDFYLECRRVVLQVLTHIGVVTRVKPDDTRVLGCCPGVYPVVTCLTSVTVVLKTRGSEALIPEF
jgi:hypothetical protein